MKLLHFFASKVPDESVPIDLMGKLFKAVARGKPNATMADLRYGVVIIAGRLVEPEDQPHVQVGRMLCLLLERGEKVTVDWGSHDRLLVGLSFLGNWCYAWNGAPIDLDDRPPAQDIPGWDNAMTWLHRGERGQSSEAMCRALYGYPLPDGNLVAHPLDPDDLRRCRLFLEMVPEARARVGELAQLSPIWKAYAEHWDEINRLFDEEVPAGKLPKTAALMRSLQGQRG